MSKVYVLRLVGDNFYVGKSDNVQERFHQHVQGKGSAWTKLHEPLCIEEVRLVQCAFAEDNVVKEYMIRYGMDRVRGGSYSRVQLDDASRAFLEREFRSASNRCFRCGQSGHFSWNCRSRLAHDDAITPILESREPCQHHIRLSVKIEGRCFKCRRTGHCAMNCVSKTTIDDDRCFQCGESGHWAINCYERTTGDENSAFNAVEFSDSEF